MAGLATETKLVAFRETDAWKKSEIGRDIIVGLLKADGWYVILSDDYIGQEEKAPRMWGPQKDLILPDLDIARQGQRLWAEVKTKSEASWTRITQQYEHGIPLRHMRHYEEVERQTGNAIWLYVYELKTGQILRAPLRQLAEKARLYNGHKMSKGGMIFFPRDSFEMWRQNTPL